MRPADPHVIYLLKTPDGEVRSYRSPRGREELEYDSEEDARADARVWLEELRRDGEAVPAELEVWAVETAQWIDCDGETVPGEQEVYCVALLKL